MLLMPISAIWYWLMLKLGLTRFSFVEAYLNPYCQLHSICIWARQTHPYPSFSSASPRPHLHMTKFGKEVSAGKRVVVILILILLIVIMLIILIIIILNLIILIITTKLGKGARAGRRVVVPRPANGLLEPTCCSEKHTHLLHENANTNINTNRMKMQTHLQNTHDENKLSCLNPHAAQRNTPMLQMQIEWKYKYKYTYKIHMRKIRR